MLILIIVGLIHGNVEYFYKADDKINFEVLAEVKNKLKTTILGAGSTYFLEIMELKGSYKIREKFSHKFT